MRKAFIIGAVGAILTAGGATAAIAATDDHPSTPTPAAASTPIGETDARRIAADSVPGATVTETGLESVGGRQAWNIHLNTATGRQEVFVDAATGQILRTDRSNGDSPQLTPTSSRMIPIPSRVTPTTTRHDNRPGTDDNGGADDGPGHDVGDDHGGR